MEALAKLFGGIIGTTLVVIVFAAAFGLLTAWPIKWCWNEVMPYIFKLPEISYGKAWCLWFLIRVATSRTNNK